MTKKVQIILLIACSFPLLLFGQSIPYNDFLKVVKKIETDEELTLELVQTEMNKPLSRERIKRRNFQVYRDKNYEMRFFNHKGWAFFTFSFRGDSHDFDKAMLSHGFLPPGISTSAKGDQILTYRSNNHSFKLYECNRRKDPLCMHEAKISQRSHIIKEDENDESDESDKNDED